IYDKTPGNFVPLTLILNPDHDTPVMNQEVFGPVLPVVIYDTIQQAISYANDTIYGLGAYLRGEDKVVVEQVCQQLKTGNISVNNTSYLIPQVPFGGYKPASGNFRQHGTLGLRNYTEIKVISKPV
ncbi:MAG: aldehyde dehydrogenase family protein, partial [Candidatus Absconditabacterales bacterium]